MDDIQREAFRQRLLQERDALAGDLAAHGGGMKPDIMRELRDPEDQAAMVTELWKEDRIAGGAQHLLRKIDFALQRLSDGSYDRCSECGENIPLERLEAKPSVSLCVRCQANKERA